MKQTLTKICGLRDVETAVKAVEMGADFIGLVFHPKSIRNVGLDVAAKIASAVISYGAHPVAVVVDHDASQINDICQRTKIRHVQFHGDKAIESLPSIDKAIIKILCVKVAANGNLLTSHQKVLAYIDPSKDYLLYDNEAPGSGERFSLRNFYPIIGFKFFIAGGLDAGNVSEVILLTKPDGVDVSSGVESQPGIKDIKKIKMFIDKAKKTEVVK
ncbi:MAG: phosphoribosylanthranilate isomerase [Lentisphaerota bacterium]